MAYDVRKIRKQYLDNFNNSIINNQNKLFSPASNIKYKNVSTNSCFDIKKYTGKKYFNDITFDIKMDIPKKPMKTKSVDMYISNYQNNILQWWFDACIKMYNETVNYIRINVNSKSIIIYKDKVDYRFKLNKNLKNH